MTDFVDLDYREYSTPEINYKSIKINNVDVALSGTANVSFQSPYNRIDIVMRPIEHTPSYYEVRITKENEAYDIGLGNLAYMNQSVPLNADTSFSINVNSTNFNKGDGLYRISLYAKSSVDGSWDVTYMLFGLNESEPFMPSDSDDFEVLTIRDIPNNSEETE